MENAGGRMQNKLTKKTQEKVTINPIEKEPHPSNRHK